MPAVLNIPADDSLGVAVVSAIRKGSPQKGATTETTNLAGRLRRMVPRAPTRVRPVPSSWLGRA
jgi:hypothetical protein